MYVDMESREGNLDAQRYLRVHQSLPPKERNAHMPEQICELAAVPAADLIAWVSRQVWQEGSAKAAMCMSFNRDKVLEKFAMYAMASPDNIRHGEIFMKASGLLPSPGRGGGPGISIFNMPSASSGAVALAGSKSETIPTGAAGLRGMDEEIVELAKVMQTGDVDKYGIPDDDPDDDDDSEEDDED